MQSENAIWYNGKLIDAAQANVSVLAHGLHYGSGVFEGIRAYQTDQGAAIFRLRDHFKRFAYSASVLNMTLPYSIDELIDATCNLFRKLNLQSGYIRPIAFYGAGTLGVHPKQNPIEVAIAVLPWGKYLPEGKLAIKTSGYIRIHPRSTVTDAKICGHYVNSQLALLDINNSHYHDILMLDADGNVSEGSGANIFIVKDNTLLTPPPGTILPGLTRDTVFTIAKKQGIDVKETVLTLEDVYHADEAFFCGTAAEISPFHSLDDKPIADGETGAITAKIATIYHDMVHGKLSEYQNYLTYVSN